ncbi:MAG: HAD family phosphatase [bacterium]|nr:HAD family phosphatase [bacterium]
MIRTKAVLFDLDGTLIASMPAHAQAWRAVLADIGIELDDLYIQLHEGEKAEVTITRLAAERGMSLSADQYCDLIKRKRALYRPLAPKGLIPEARVVVEELNRDGVMCCIVTGSIRVNMNGVVLPEERALFRHIITADDYERGKPAPDPYLIAIERSGFAASECAALENAPLGIQSAQAAGLRTIAITTTLPPKYLREADEVITHYEELRKLL